MGEVIQDGNAETSREGTSGNDGGGTGAAAADYWDALPPARGQSGRTGAGHNPDEGIDG